MKEPRARGNLESLDESAALKQAGEYKNPVADGLFSLYFTCCPSSCMFLIIVGVLCVPFL